MQMKNCDVCGKPMIATRNRKYCDSCKRRIKRYSYTMDYKKAVQKVKDEVTHAEQYQRTVHTMTLAQVVHKTLESGRTYGYEVAYLEGRLNNGNTEVLQPDKHT